jgi:nicotinamide mononucleotide transporter
MSGVEIAGFLTGALSVWLAVKQSPWTWPAGIANAIFFFVLFWRARLYGDMALQLLFFSLCALGWYRWLFGGVGHTTLRVSRLTPRGIAAYSTGGVLATALVAPYLRSVGDASPWLDAVTTVMSIEAQYLMTKKIFEHWYVWIAADAIYIWLYGERQLYLTAVLYAIFLAMCIAGLTEWRRSLRETAPLAPSSFTP